MIEVGLYIFLMIELLKIEKVYISKGKKGLLGKGKKGLLGNIRRTKLFRKIIIDINSDFVCFKFIIEFSDLKFSARKGIISYF